MSGSSGDRDGCAPPISIANWRTGTDARRIPISDGGQKQRHAAGIENKHMEAPLGLLPRADIVGIVAGNGRFFSLIKDAGRQMQGREARRQNLTASPRLRYFTRFLQIEGSDPIRDADR